MCTVTVTPVTVANTVRSVYVLPMSISNTSLSTSHSKVEQRYSQHQDRWEEMVSQLYQGRARLDIGEKNFHGKDCKAVRLSRELVESSSLEEFKKTFGFGTWGCGLVVHVVVVLGWQLDSVLRSLFQPQTIFGSIDLLRAGGGEDNELLLFVRQPLSLTESEFKQIRLK